MSELAIVVLLQLLLHLTVAVVHRNQWMAHIRGRELEWSAERNDLLDRIQAPSFDAYANKVIREAKTDHPSEDDRQDQIDYIS